MYFACSYILPFFVHFCIDKFKIYSKCGQTVVNRRSKHVRCTLTKPA